MISYALLTHSAVLPSGLSATLSAAAEAASQASAVHLLDDYRSRKTANILHGQDLNLITLARFWMM